MTWLSIEIKMRGIMNLSLPTFKQTMVDDRHRYQDLCCLFRQTFGQSENTRLIKGDGEPVYLPAGAQYPYHRIIFANGYFASALHEVAHWCIAGKQRRLQEDYGYWYCPDGRDTQQQRDFERVEIKPQAIEWAFSAAAQAPFRVSTDNLLGVQADTKGFQLKVHNQVLHYVQYGFPSRAQRFIRVLQDFYHSQPLCPKSFLGTTLAPCRGSHGKV